LDIAINVVEEIAASIFRIVQEIYAVWGKTGIIWMGGQGGLFE